MKKFLLIMPLFIVLASAVFLLTTNKAHSLQVAGCSSTDLTGQFDFGSPQAFFNGQKIDAPLFARTMETPNVLGTSNPENRWIEIDLSDQKLKAWDGDSLFLETPISTGLPGTPTPTGVFHIWTKLRYVRMEGGQGRYYYNLPNVPFTMFFANDSVPSWKGYGLHGTYWHNHFGTRRSHGCVNLPTPIAERLYYWTTPVLGDGKQSTPATADNPGTKIVIHE